MRCWLGCSLKFPDQLFEMSKRPRVRQLFQTVPTPGTSDTSAESEFERRFPHRMTKKSEFEECFSRGVPELYETAREIVPRIPDLRKRPSLGFDWDPWEAVCSECTLLQDGLNSGEHPMWDSTLSYIQESSEHIHLGLSSADLADFVTFFPLLTLIYNYNADLALSQELVSVGATRPLEIGKMLISSK